MESYQAKLLVKSLKKVSIPFKRESSWKVAVAETLMIF